MFELVLSCSAFPACSWQWALISQELRYLPISTGAQVKLLEAHVRQGVSQLRAAKELSEVAQRSLADAGGRPGQGGDDGRWWRMRQPDSLCIHQKLLRALPLTCSTHQRVAACGCSPSVPQRGGPRGRKRCCARWTSARLRQRWSGARLQRLQAGWSSRRVGTTGAGWWVRLHAVRSEPASPMLPSLQLLPLRLFGPCAGAGATEPAGGGPAPRAGSAGRGGAAAVRAGWAELLACRLHLVADELLACSYSRLL